MKKLLSIILAAMLTLTMAACGETEVNNEENANGENEVVENNEQEDTAKEEVTVMSYQEYAAAQLDSEVTVETYVQATQSWWDNKVTIYAQSEDGAYFIYECAASEEDAAKLVPGTKIRVSGVKGAWEGEVEIMDGSFEIIEGDTFVAEPTDLTAILADADALIAHQNELATFKGMTIEKIEYKNGEPGDDIYVTLSKDDASYDFCVERYLTGPETDLYKSFETLKAGDVVDVTGFVYWYVNVNTHITGITLAQ